MSTLTGKQIGWAFITRQTVKVMATPYGYIWLNTTGSAVRFSSTYPTNLDTSGTALGTAAAVAANTALSNLAVVAINTSLVSDTPITDDIGSLAIPWRRGYFGTGTSAFVFVGAAQNLTIAVTEPAAGRTVTFPDPGANVDVCYTTGTQTIANKNIDCSANTVTKVPAAALLIAAQAAGDQLYAINGTTWGRIGIGAAGQVWTVVAGLPAWATPTISALPQTFTIEGGATDITVTVVGQTGAAAVGIPDLGGVAQDYVFTAEAQVLTNKSLTAPAITGGSAIELATFSLRSSGAAFDLVIGTSVVYTADRTLTLNIPDANMTMTLGGTFTTLGTFIQTGAFNFDFTLTGATNVTFPTGGTLAVVAGALGAAGITGGTAIELTSFSIRSTGAAFDLILATTAVYTADRTLTINIPTGANAALTLTGDVTWVGAFTTQFTVTGNTAITFPTTGTVITEASASVLTNKTYDCDGAGNVFTNLNATELDPVSFPAAGNVVFGMPFTIIYCISNQAAAVNIYNANCPYKLRVIDAYSISQSGDGGTWKLNNGALGAGTDITDVVTVAASDLDVDRPAEINDAAWEIAANGSLSLVPDGGGALDAMIFITAIRVD